jgi:hypothetical protein
MNQIRFFIFSLFFTLFTMPAMAGMARFIRVADAQTIVVERDGMQIAVRLAGVAVAPADEEAARAFLTNALAGKWLLVERDVVYRSPDALNVNQAMREHGWLYPDNRRVVELGELDPEPRAQSSARVSEPKSRPAPRTNTRTSRRSPGGRRRG